MIRIAYITNPEVGNILRDMKKDDTLLLYYSSGEQNVPVGEIQSFMRTKGTITFKEYVNIAIFAYNNLRYLWQQMLGSLFRPISPQKREFLFCAKQKTGPSTTTIPV